MCSRGVEVSCRVRDLSLNDSRLQCLGPTTLVVDNLDNTFSFDTVFNTTHTQQEIFEVVGKPFVYDVIRGYNCTILAYGQTGSGKTYTTLGEINVEEKSGLIPRILHLLLLELNKDRSSDEFSVSVSFIEVYQERLRDLLLTRNSSALRIREERVNGNKSVNSSGNVWVEGATEIGINSVESGLQMLSRGQMQRSVGSTCMNADSSRSHAVFTITVTQQKQGGNDTLTTSTSRLCIVDLAGSERGHKTLASGQRLNEAKHINKSLSALGNVIHALTDEQTKYIPYRDSKLTRLLQSSLGGNAKTHLLLTVTSASLHMEETLSTLRFGARAKKMKNIPSINIKTLRPGNETVTGNQQTLLYTMEHKIENLCQYIRELEARSQCPKCGKIMETCLEKAHEAERDDDIKEDDPENDVVEAPLEPIVVIEDIVMQQELLTLRRTLSELQQQLHAQDHAKYLSQSVDNLEQEQLEPLHHRQERTIQQQELELREADAQIAALRVELREMRDAFEGVTRRLTEMEKHRLDAENAEAAILRRQIDQVEQQKKNEISVLIKERDEIRKGNKEMGNECGQLREENALLRVRVSELMRQSNNNNELPESNHNGNALVSKKTPTIRPMTALELKGGTNSLAIQHWWSGQLPESHGDGDREANSVPIPEPKTLGTITRTGSRHRFNSSLGPIEDSVREQVVHTSGGSIRPFRARLVGLLNSLEEETTVYKSLVGETQDVTSNPRRRTTSNGSKYHLPELDKEEKELEEVRPVQRRRQTIGVSTDNR